MISYRDVCEAKTKKEMLARFDDGTHEEGYCIECCPNPHGSRQAGIGGYERMDCDQ